MFDSDRLYRVDDPALKVLGTYHALAHWRSNATGPRYVKLGRRVFYRGSDLNEYINQNVIEPRDVAAG